MNTLQLPLYVKTKFALAPRTKIYLMAGGFASYTLKADIFQRLTMPGEQPLKLKWSLYEPKVQVFENEVTNIHFQQRWNAGLAVEIGVDISEKIAVGIGFRQPLNNMAAIDLSSGLGSVKPDTRMWTITASAAYFF